VREKKIHANERLSFSPPLSSTCPFLAGGWIVLKIFGVVYFLIAVISFYGAYGIWNEIPRFVDRFTIYFFWSAVTYFLVQIIVIVVEEIELRQIFNEEIQACKNEEAELGVPSNEINCNINYTDTYLGSWIATFIIGIIIQFYLYIVIRSYNIELRQKAESGVQLGVLNPFQTVSVQQQQVQQPVQPGVVGYPTDYNKQNYGP
jgi:hypothetical protein